MKIGDIVKLKLYATRAGVVTDFIDRKCWRSEKHGKKVDWSKIDPEKHAVVLFDDGVLRIPVVELEIVDVPR
tara:strand:- start:710 stop:925 length:216 start_codon:yes stop_codon:yes gene_type:complete